MSEHGDDLRTAYVRAAAALMGMSLDPEREVAVAAVLTRLTVFAADLEAFTLRDDVEIAGTFTP